MTRKRSIMSGSEWSNSVEAQPFSTAGGTRGGTNVIGAHKFGPLTASTPPSFRTLRRAGYRIRTGDLQLGKLTLYR